MEIVVYEDKFKNGVVELVNNIQENEFGSHSVSGRPDLKNIPEFYQKNNGNFWVALEGKEVVGAIGLSDFHNGFGELRRFYVKKDLRRQGVGKKLFDILMQFAKEKNYKTIFLATHSDPNHIPANNFYLKNGFERTIDYIPGIPAPTKDNTFYKMNL